MQRTRNIIRIRRLNNVQAGARYSRSLASTNQLHMDWKPLLLAAKHGAPLSPHSSGSVSIRKHVVVR